jgi:DNA-binding transcriptional regulator YbjK
MARKQNPEQRRRELCDAAIILLANDGIKGVTHLKVDRSAGVPEGTTSFYFRTSAALIGAVAARIADLDLADLEYATRAVQRGGDDRRGAVQGLAKLVIQSGAGQRLIRSRARLELAIPASRDAALNEAFFHNQQSFFDLHREVVLTLAPKDIDPSLADEQAFILMTFISGLMLALARGDRTVNTAEHLETIITAMVTGMLRAEQVRS